MHKLIFFLSFLHLFGAKIQINDQIVEVEIADTHPKRARGLMGRLHLEENHGMLFIYPEPEILSFWMKNTLIPLSIAFFSEDQVCINLLDMDIANESNLKYYKSKSPAKYALEVPKGWFKKHKITQGTKFFFLNAE